MNKLNFPHPTDNTMFLQCGAYNRLFIVQCPSGEVYDQATTTCIKPSVSFSTFVFVSRLTNDRLDGKVIEGPPRVDVVVGTIPVRAIPKTW